MTWYLFHHACQPRFIESMREEDGELLAIIAGFDKEVSFLLTPNDQRKHFNHYNTNYWAKNVNHLTLTEIINKVKDLSAEIPQFTSVYQEELTKDLFSALAVVAEAWENKKSDDLLKGCCFYLETISKVAIAQDYEVRGQCPWCLAWEGELEPGASPFEALLQSTFYLFQNGSGVTTAVLRFVRALKLLGVSRVQIEVMFME